MRYDGLQEAVSESEPCGPDLDETGDDTYLNYVLPAADRLPSRFYDSSTGAPFDRAGVDLKSEVKAISALLERTRDLRLLTLEARFQCLGGQVVGFSECLQAMAALLEHRWEHVHPQAFEGDYTLRQNTLGALDDRTTVILPLEYAPLAADRRLGQICLRDHKAAAGQVQAREEGRQLDTGSVLDALRKDEGIGEIHAAIVAAEQALASIRAVFADAAGYEYAPDFSGLLEQLAQLRIVVEAALPSLAAVAEPAFDPVAAPAEAGDGQAGVEAAAPPPAAASQIPDHAAAAAALLACEHYFAHGEPSSPALILVHQARMLVGQPLVVALDTLLPDRADRALINVDPSRGLQLGMAAMRSITSAARNGAVTSDGTDVKDYRAASRGEAESLILGVEEFFRRNEPSSPVPVLLARGRSFMNRDFAAILSDIIKGEAQES